ncbi:MAG: DUF4129 domain-containing protein [Chloroflexota bacterium]
MTEHERAPVKDAATGSPQETSQPSQQPAYDPLNPIPMGDPGSLQPLLVAVLVTALVTGLIVVIRLASPSPAWRLLTVAVFLVALEAVYTSRWLAHPDRRQLNRSTYRLAELVVIALALRLLTWALTGGIPEWQVWRSYLLSPLSFFDGLYVGYLLCAVFAWERAASFSATLRALAISPAEERFYTLSRDEQGHRSWDRPVDRQRPTIFRSLVGSWLGGGLLLGLCAALSTVDLATVEVTGGVRNIVRLGLDNTMLLALLVYFILGLWMISQSRLDMMRARWLADGVDADEDIVDNWRRGSIVILLLFALIAAFLPIGSTFAAAVVLNAIFGAVLFVAQIAFLVLSTLLVALLSLLGIGAPPEETEELLPAPAPTPPPEAAPAPMSETAALVAGGLFWGLVAAVALVALVFFLRDRGITIHSETLERVWIRLKQWFARLWSGASRGASTVQRSLRRSLSALRPGGDRSRAPWRFLRVNALPPREQIRYFYLSTVRRAADEGVPREKSETPSEYARDLQTQWPDAEEEIEALTGAFLEARYSRRDYEPEDVNPIKEVWKRVRRTIRHRLNR